MPDPWLEQWVKDHAEEARRQLREQYGDGWLRMSRDEQLDVMAGRLAVLVTPPGMAEELHRGSVRDVLAFHRRTG